ncbi:MAG: peptidoglycan-associated lipoprotein Pal [Steroidobacteraceae bacterium]
MRRALPILLAAAALMLAACAHRPAQPTTGANSAVGANGSGAQSSGASGASSSEGAGANGANAAEGAGAAEGLLAQRTIHFAFDSSEITGVGTDIVSANAKYLSSRSNIHVRLEGNTDERGSREYNIGLGERRAQQVRQAMLLQGVSDSQISTVSYGAERPVDPGHNETAWAKNRRVDIIYLNGPLAQAPQPAQASQPAQAPQAGQSSQ